MTNDLKSYELNIYDEEYKSEIMQDILQISRENEFQFITTDRIPTDDGSMLYRYYINTFDNDWIYDNIRMISGDVIDFTNPDEKNYMSSNINDPNAKGTFSSFNNRYFMQENEVFQFMNASTHLKNAYNQSFSFRIDGEKAGLEIQKILNEKYDSKIMEFEMLGFQSADIESINSVYRTSDIIFAFGYSIIAIMLIMICIIIKDKKEILIRKMNGQSSLYIVYKLYFLPLIFSWLLYSLTFVCLWMIFIGFDFQFFKNVFYDIVKFVVVGFFTVPLILFLSYIYIFFTTNIIELKNNQSLKLMTHTNIILKIMISVSMLMPFVTSLNMFIPNFQRYMHLEKMKEEYQDYYYLSHFEGSDNELNQLFQDNIYINFDDYNLASYFTNLMKTGIPYGEDPVMDIPIIHVNQKYASSYEFIEDNGQKVDISSYQKPIMLIPDKYKNDDIDFSGEQMIVKETFRHINLNFRQSVYAITDPVIIVHHDFNSMDFSHSTLYFQTQNRDMLEKAISSITDAPFGLLKVQNGINYSQVKSEFVFIQTISYFIIYTFVYSLFMLQFILLYIQDNKKELTVSYMLGKSRLDRYGNLWLINLCIYLFVILIVLLFRKIPILLCIEFVIIFLTFDCIVLWLLIRRFEKKNMVSYLKGEG